MKHPKKLNIKEALKGTSKNLSRAKNAGEIFETKARESFAIRSNNRAFPQRWYRKFPRVFSPCEVFRGSLKRRLNAPGKKWSFFLRSFGSRFYQFFYIFFLVIMSRTALATEELTTEVEVVNAVSEENYSKAVQLADKALSSIAPDPNILFLKGFSQIKLGEREAGLENIKRYLNTGGGQYENQARKFIHQLSPNRLDLYKTLQVGVGYDTRVFHKKSPTTFEYIDDFAFQGRLKLHAIHETGAQVEYKIYGINYAKADEQSRLEQRLEIGSAFSLGKAVIDWRLLGEFDMLDYKKTFYEYGARVDTSWLLSKRSLLRIGLEGGKDEFPRSHAFDATYLKPSLFLQWFKMPWTFWIQNYGYWNNANNSELSFFEYGGELAGMYQAGKKMNVGLSLRGSLLEFDKHDTTKGVKEHSAFYSAHGWLSYALWKNIVFAPSVQYIGNNSNFKLNDYDETVVAMDMILKF